MNILFSVRRTHYLHWSLCSVCSGTDSKLLPYVFTPWGLSLGTFLKMTLQRTSALPACFHTAAAIKHISVEKVKRVENVCFVGLLLTATVRWAFDMFVPWCFRVDGSVYNKGTKCCVWCVCVFQKLTPTQAAADDKCWAPCSCTEASHRKQVISSLCWKPQ